MSVSVVKEKGMTVVTVASDPSSMLPPVLQILKSLCYSPACCSAYKGLMQCATLSALGTIQIMVGLVNLGLGPGHTSLHPEDFACLGAGYWLGGVFLFTGIVSILVGRFPSVCSVGFAVFMNIVGTIFAVIAIVMYSIDLADFSNDNICDWARHNDDNCSFVQSVARRLLTAVDVTMIVMAVLQLCVCISLSVLGVKALVNRMPNKGDKYDGIYEPVTEVLTTSPGA